LKIIFVIDSLGSGGAQRLFVNIVNGISATHQASVFLYNANSDFFRSDLLPAIPVSSLERKKKSGFRLEVVKALRQHLNDADIVVSFLPTANIYCAITGLLSRRLRLIACEMSVVNETESTVRRLMANLANYLSSHVVCNSFTQAEYVNALPCMGNKASAIWNGCTNLPYVVRTARDARYLSLMVVGRVAYPKNGVRLLQALQIFHERNGFLPQVSWAGRDDSDDRAQLMKREMLEFLAVYPAVAERFCFIGECSDIGSLYAAADALILPSIYEGVPVVICEAMLSGCPVVATRISDNERILGANEERGFLCDPLSPESICSAIERRVAMSSESIERMTRDARQFAEHHFLIPKMIDGYLRVIEAVAR
jgi:glycosyltransferase involved in cell wall biosynthesis